MRLIYTLGIVLYGAVLHLASLFVPKAREWVQGRRNYFGKLPDVAGKKVYWFHCASLGEFDQGIPVMRVVREREPETFILVTFFSPSGFKHYHKRQHPADHACYLPLDTPRNARRFIRHFKPEKTFFVKYEFWANHILAARRAGSSLYLVSGLFRPGQVFFKWYGSFFRKVLRQFEVLFVQYSDSAALLKEIGIEGVVIAGDTRYDQVLAASLKSSENAVLEAFVPEKNALVLGSSWPEGEEKILPALNDSAFPGKTIIAPHDVSEAHVEAIAAQLTRPFVRYTQVKAGGDLRGADVLILDTIGQLASAYRYGSIAYVGGGFSGKLHNILEPAVFGLPVLFGPEHARFPEADHFLEAGIAREFHDTESFVSELTQMLEAGEELRKRTREFIAKNTGAAQRIAAVLYADPLP